ncbi:MAG: TIR domain-containing protein [Rhizobiaceae bacterium]
MINQLPATEFYKLSYEEFEKKYENSSYQSFLDYIESRMRLEIISIIRTLDKKGEVSFELRKKSALSAYNKVQKELTTRITEFGSNSLSLHDIIKDIVGCRIVCDDDVVLESILRQILRVDSLTVQSDGIELYDSPFRKFVFKTSRQDKIEEIFQHTANGNDAGTPFGFEKTVRAGSKQSNYESLHFYAGFSNPQENMIPSGMYRNPEEIRNEGRRRREEVEQQYITDLWNSLDGGYKDLIGSFPVEFQIRTITEHLWASEEHKFVYGQVKQSGSHLSEQEFETLKQAFVGLKFAYHHVDYLRSVIKSINFSSQLDDAAYTGKSKDLTAQRFIYFDDTARRDFLERFEELDKMFFALTLHNDVSSTDYDERYNDLLDRLLNLHQDITLYEDSRAKPSDQVFDIEKWGTNRVFLLFVAYLLLFSRKSRIDNNLQRFLQKIRLHRTVGNANLDFAKKGDKANTFLASCIYERIRTFDQFAVNWIKNEDPCQLSKSKIRSCIFLDPLVNIRHASSLYLQSEFAGARKSIEAIFKYSNLEGLTDWTELELSKSFSKSEIYMRHSQYFWYEYFFDRGELLDKFEILNQSVQHIFSTAPEGYDKDTYRSYCWYFAVRKFLLSQKPHLPASFLSQTQHCLEYLRTHHASAKSSDDKGLLDKIEYWLALIPLAQKDEQFGDPNRALAEFSQLSTKLISHPDRVIKILRAMAHTLHMGSTSNLLQGQPFTFVSYVHDDANKVKEILQTMSDTGLKAKYDGDFELSLGLQENVERAMKQSDSAILFVSEKYLNSEGWVNEERAFMLSKRRKGNYPVYVVVDGIDANDLRQRAPLLEDLIYVKYEAGKVLKTIARIAKEIRKFRKRNN